MIRCKVKNKIKKILQENNEYSVPVNVVSLAKKLGFAVVQQNLDYDGAILVNEEKEFPLGNATCKKLITVNVNLNYRRKLFTVAHELGHFINEVYGTKNSIYAHREERNKYATKEVQANLVASELLMPTDLLSEFVKTLRKHYNDHYLIVDAISDYFNVSYSAAALRYQRYLDEV